MLSYEPNVVPKTFALSALSALEQRFGTAALPEFRGDLDSDAGDFGLELGNIGLEFFYTQQRQVFWLCRFAARFEIRFIHALLRSPSFPVGGGGLYNTKLLWTRLACAGGPVTGIPTWPYH